MRMITPEPELTQRQREILRGVVEEYVATGQPVGPYATIPVLGATQWVAPNWMGLPVQWCGLVYADALYGLRMHDPYGPWKKLADGITASGVRQTWPLGKDRFSLG